MLRTPRWKLSLGEKIAAQWALPKVAFPHIVSSPFLWKGVPKWTLLSFYRETLERLLLPVVAIMCDTGFRTPLAVSPGFHLALHQARTSHFIVSRGRLRFLSCFRTSTGSAWTPERTPKTRICITSHLKILRVTS